MSRIARALLIAPAALLLVACGGSESSEDLPEGADAYVTAIATSMTAGAEESAISDEQAQCISEGMVRVIGYENIKKAGTPEEYEKAEASLDFGDLELTQEQGEEMYDGFGECGVDVQQMMLDELQNVDSLPAEAVACVEGVITDEAVREFYVAMMIGDSSAADAELTTGMQQCMADAANEADPQEGDSDEGDSSKQNSGKQDSSKK